MSSHVILAVLSSGTPDAGGAPAYEVCLTCVEAAPSTVCPLAPRAELVAALADVRARLDRPYYYDGRRQDQAEAVRLTVAVWRVDVAELPWFAEDPIGTIVWEDGLLEELAALRG
ncbi:hypothetical protein [Kitasatospora sp. NPDC093679]|uniref:hypothetical protein n=1 Tax=Kitasatospora sp. NPDC093679 TaxID=3154983 RepID=UPI0034165975